MRLVNVVGGGDLGASINLREFVHICDLPEQDYEPEIYPGVKFKIEPDLPTILLFRTGKYHITGGKSIDEIFTTHNKLIELVESKLGITVNHDSTPDIRNLVYVVDYGRELELNQLAVALGLEDVEYNPEKHPSVHYSPEGGGHLMAFRTGKVILTGVSDPDHSHQIVDDFVSRLDSLFES